MITQEDKQWQEIMELAKKYKFIAHASRGTAILMHPTVQKERGIYERIQKAHQKRSE